MSELEVLIQQCCPDGVRVVELGTFAKAEVGKNKGCTCNRAYSITQKGLIPTSEYFKEAKVTSEDTSGYKIVKKHWFVYSPSRIDVGSINYLQDEEDVIVSPLNIVFSVNENIIDAKYLLTFLNSRKGTWQILSKREGIEGTGRKMLPFAKFSTIEVPVPPLEVQREIVRILDQFTELTTELTAELTARKKQYEYYRDELLIHGTDVTWMTLGDIGNVCMCKRIMKAETSSEGDVPFFKIGTFGKEPDAYISKEKFDEYRQKYSFPKKGDVLISAAGTIGRTVIYDGKPAYYQDSNIVWLDNDETKVLNKYLFYYYQLQPWAVSTGGTIARLYNDNISKAKIAVPSLKEQRRIVSILDRFDTLCNDLTNGLPAEIEARQKQYEYYRDKLLTFEEKSKYEAI